MPKVSVLLPAYNTKAEYLREAVDSILAQTFTDFELLILDDCSTHPSVAEVVSSYSDGRIKFFRNDRNLGISGSRNKLIELAQGEYLAVTDHDDVSLPQRFELQVDFLDKHPEVGVVGGALEIFPKKGKSSLPQGNVDIENLMMLKTGIDHQVSMIRKSVLTDNGLRYEEEFSPSEDHRLWTRLIGKTQFANLPDTLLRYRVHGQNTSCVQRQRNIAKASEIIAWVRAEHPDIWQRTERTLVKKSKYKLFEIFNILTVKESHKETRYLLLGFIPLLKKEQKIRLPR